MVLAADGRLHEKDGRGRECFSSVGLFDDEFVGRLVYRTKSRTRLVFFSLSLSPSFLRRCCVGGSLYSTP